MHITTINRVLPPPIIKIQSRIIHQTMNHPPTTFAVIFVTSICFLGIMLFTLLAFSEFFHRRVPPEYERIFFDRVLVTRKCTASTRTEDNECAICLGAFEPNNSVSRSTSCSHEFHTVCYKQWLVSHPSCPYCRKDVMFKATAEGRTHKLYCPAI